MIETIVGYNMQYTEQGCVTPAKYDVSWQRLVGEGEEEDVVQVETFHKYPRAAGEQHIVVDDEQTPTLPVLHNDVTASLYHLHTSHNNQQI